MIFRYVIEKDILIKDFLKEQNIPGNLIKAIKTLNGQFLVNDQTVTSIYKMKPGDILEVVFPSSTRGENITSVKGDFKILYEDSYLLIVDKEPNLATIPTRKHYDHSLANYVMSYYKRMGIEANIHFVGRLDMATSGIIMLAKNSYVLTLLQKANYEKFYLLEVLGHLKEKKGTIECGIKRDENSIIKRKVTTDFINSKTEYEVLLEKENTSVVLAKLLTGKTHQLRLHFSYLGHPIVGDMLYGTPSDQLHLHSHLTRFMHPIKKEMIEVKSFPSWYQK